MVVDVEEVDDVVDDVWDVVELEDGDWTVIMVDVVWTVVAVVEDDTVESVTVVVTLTGDSLTEVTPEDSLR